MNWLDWVLIAILLFFAALSARRGLAREIIGLAATVAALVLGMWFYGTAGTFVAPYVGSERIANLIGFLLVVFGVMLCGSFLGWVVSRFLKTIGLSFFDRLLGAGFGLLKGLVVAVALLTAFVAFGPVIAAGSGIADANGADHDKSMNQNEGAPLPAVVHSRIAPYVLEASRLAVAIAPMELKSSFRKQYDGVKSALTEDRDRSQGTR